MNNLILFWMQTSRQNLISEWALGTTRRVAITERKAASMGFCFSLNRAQVIFRVFAVKRIKLGNDKHPVPWAQPHTPTCDELAIKCRSVQAGRV